MAAQVWLLSANEGKEVLKVLRSPRLLDRSPTETLVTPLDDGAGAATG